MGSKTKKQNSKMELVKYFFDTNILIEAIRLHNFKADQFLLDKYHGKFFLSSVVVAELFSGASAQDREVENFLRYFIGNFKLVRDNLETAVLAGQLRFHYKMAMPDAMIAASVIENGLVLVTHNQKDFAKIPHLRMVKKVKIAR